MSFRIKDTIGQHSVYTYDVERYNLDGMLKSLFDVKDLSSLHTISESYLAHTRGDILELSDIESDLHKKFYTFMKSNETFKNAYLQIIRDIHAHFFPEEDGIIFQTFPSIRFQFPRNIAVPPHCDSDSLGKHPIGEQNFLIPITDMKETTRLFIESEPNKGDFSGIDLVYGEILKFNGNKCIHYNQQNLESHLRISFDFRVITIKDYFKYINSDSITFTNPRDPDKTRVPIKMTVGGYYQVMFKNQKDVLYRSISSKIVQTRPSFDGSEADACYNYFKDGDPFLTEFKKTEELETHLKSRIGAKHCFMVPSGTSAIITGLVALDIKPGDEVIVPNYTMVATMNAVRLIGAVPILVDVDSETFTMNLDAVRKSVNEKTKAVIHVSLNNRSCGLKSIVDFCKGRRIYLLEDAAQSLGCTLDGKHYGSFGDVGCFSLSTPKIITTGQGGFIITDNDDIAAKILRIKNFGRRSGGIEEYDSFGVNFKFTDIQAVIGLAQLSKIDYRIKHLRSIFYEYYQELSVCRNVKILPPQNEEWFPWFVEVLTNHRSHVIKFLDRHNIQTRITYPTLSSISKYSGEFPNADYVSSKGIFLPTHMLLHLHDVRFICNIIRIIDYSIDDF